MDPRTRSSPRARTSSPRTRTTPLRKESSYESTRSVNTPPPFHGLPDFDDYSPYYQRRPSFNDMSPSYFDRSNSPYRPSFDRNSIEPPSIEEPTINIDPLNSDKNQREERIRNLRQDAINDFLPGAACFFGEKLMVTTEYINDIYYISLLYYQQQEYERALEILNTRKTINKSVRCRYLAALCSLALENARDALDYLGHKNPFSGKDLAQNDPVEGAVKLEACLCYARGKAYLMLKDIPNARECFKEALTVDVKCYDALEALVKNNMIDENAEWQFVMTLPFDEHCGPDADYFRYLYGLKLKRDILNGQPVDASLEKLDKSLDVKLSKAEEFISQCRYEEGLKICKEIKAQDPFFKESIPAYLTCLYELRLKNELYEYAQELVDRLNNEAVTWHAVGLYYLLINKNLEARRYFSQALNLNQFFQQSWLGYGHSFSEEKDHEQAISAYKMCSQLISGSYLPLMYIAIQYMEQNELNSAHQYFKLSLEKNNSDPYLYNEFAVYYYKTKNYVLAKQTLHEALKKAKKFHVSRSIIWEKLWCNLGHVYRHQPIRNDDRALKCFENALLRNPKNCDARASMGMIYQLRGNTARAIAEYQQAIVDGDTGGLVTELLDNALLEDSKHTFGPDELGFFQNGALDVFQIAESIHDLKDEVEIELDEDYWKKRQSAEEREEEQEEIKETQVEGMITHTDDALIIDEGDLSKSDRPKWL